MRIDLHHLLRNLRRSPASAVAAVLTLALTLGAGASVFAVVDAVLLTSPPFANPDALVTVGESPVTGLAVSRPVSVTTFDSWRARAESLAVLEAFDGTNLTLTGLGSAERVNATDTTPGFLALLGVTPARGRLFGPNDVGQAVVIVSHAFWRGRLAADPDVVGRRITLGAQDHTIVGVLPDAFFFALSPGDFWRPLPSMLTLAANTGFRVGVLARLGSETTPTLLEGVLDDVSRQSSPPAGAQTAPIATAIAGDATTTLYVLAGAALLTLLLAFTNLAGLLVVRAIGRGRELAVRTALGARQSEIARQLMLEAVALVVMGIAGGVLLALWLTPVAGSLALAQFGGVAQREVAVNWRVIGVVASIALACGAICGLLPAFLIPRRPVIEVLRRGISANPRELNARRALVTAEVALAFVLLACVTLLGASLLRLLNVRPGFDAQGVLTAQVSLPAAGYGTPERVASFYTAFQDALDQRLGSGASSIVSELPLTGDGGRRLVRTQPTDQGLEVVLRETGTAYFDVMHIPVVEGRSFTTRDDVSAPTRVMLSQSIAERLFSGDWVVGRRLWLGADGREAEIVAVVGDVAHRSLGEATVGTVYLSALQSPSRASIVVVRSNRADADVLAAVREEVQRLDSALPVYRVRSMQDVVDASPGVPAGRVLTATFLGFALLALLLGATGLFGVLAHDVARRRAELALRLALGADRRRILRAVIGQGALMIGVGIALGGVLFWWIGRALGGVLFRTDAQDFAGIGVAALVLAAAGVAAVLPAALRAANTDPMIALRAD